MWARVSTYEGSPESIDEATTYARDNIVPQARQLAGFRGVYMLSDRQTGRSLSITLWDSEDDLRASDAEADRLRQDGADHTGDTVAAVERYEVTFHDLV